MDTPAHANRPTNRLIHETSPYLQQHAHNPVDWYSWGPEALEKAKRENRPILLSIGYSACHWCHVMEHESFEREDVAQVMNELFVNIKVDREERPDLDKIYQTAHQLLTGRPGGWPLNMFLTPADHMPFFGGTYFPRERRHGMPAFTDVLRQIAAAYRERRDDVEQQNTALRDLFARLEPASANAPLTEAPLARAATQLKREFDPRHGGFGTAPKFPHPTSLELLLRRWARGRLAGKTDTEALHCVRHTLAQMARGGLYDQLGGGFCRYSVDERWEIPHFEKMLYDNAQLLPLYADSWQVTGESASGPSLARGPRLDPIGDPLFRRVALETGAWVMREMQSPDGGYYSTLDADSEGHEGKFYVWGTDEIRNLLNPEEWELIAQHYGLQGGPNFEGHWHLNVRADIAELAGRFQRTEVEIEALLTSARARLFAAREQRVRPGRDEKILTSWNGMMIRGMAHAGRLLDAPELTSSAERAFDFVRARLWRDGRLLATTKDEKAHLNAYLDDYVHLIDGGLALLAARWRDGDLDFVRALADTVLAHFEDKSGGGFYFTSDDHESLLHRPKPAGDDAIPSGNGVAAQVLLRLGHLTGETKYLEAAERALTALAGAVAQYPSAHGALLLALEDWLHPPQTVILRGESEALATWLARCHKHYAPGRLTMAIPTDAVGLSGLLAERRPLGPVTAYVCSGHTCQAPIHDSAAFEQALASQEIPFGST